MLGPGDQSMAGGEGRACMRASRADRDQVIDVLKSAFVREQLTKDELNDRIGRALAARTYADLDPLTADIPAGPRPAPRVPSTLGAVGPDLVRPPVPAPASEPPGSLAPNRPVSIAVKTGAAGIALVVLLGGIWRACRLAQRRGRPQYPWPPRSEPCSS